MEGSGGAGEGRGEREINTFFCMKSSNFTLYQSLGESGEKLWSFAYCSKKALRFVVEFQKSSAAEC